MATTVAWHGTDDESTELLTAVAHNCACVISADGVKTATCEPHKMLVEDQRALDGLIFARRTLHKLKEEEGLTDAHS